MTTTKDVPLAPKVATAGPYGVVLVGSDGSAASQGAVDFAVREAVLRGARLVAVSAFEMPDRAYRATHGSTRAELLPVMTDIARAEAQRTLDLALERAGHPALDVDLRVVVGKPSQCLLAAGQEADLLVVGARGSGPVARMVLGSVSTEVVHHAHLPVVVVPGRSPDDAGHPTA